MKLLLKIALGNLLLALGAAAFLLPNRLMATGSTGLALALAQVLPLEVAHMVAAINAVTFLLGLLCLGRRFAMTTLVSTVLFPAFLWLCQRLITGPVVQDTLLACVSAALLSGCGVGLVIKCGASTGGVDIPAILLSRRTGLPVAAFLCGLDVLALLGQCRSATPEKLVYGILTALMISLVVNKVIMTGSGAIQVLIISPKYEEISRCICGEIDRGMTFIEVCTGFCRTPQRAVLSVIAQRDLHMLNTRVLALDPTAFIVVTNVYKVHGKGFSLSR